MKSSGIGISDRRCWVPREVAYIPLIRVERAGEQMGAVAYAWVYRIPSSANRSRTGVFA